MAAKEVIDSGDESGKEQSPDKMIGEAAVIS